MVCTIKEIIMMATNKLANEHINTHAEQDLNRSIRTEGTEARKVGGNWLPWQKKGYEWH